MYLVKNASLPSGELILERTDDYMKSLMFFIDLRKEGRKLKLSEQIKVKKQICLHTNRTKLEITIDGTTIPYLTDGIMLNAQIEQLIKSDELPIPALANML